MIQMTELAAKKIQSLKAEEGRSDDHFLRVFVKKGGCSGLSYKMDFDSEIKPGDKVFENHGAKLVVDTESFMYLIGMTLEYQGGLNGKGFIFNNPNASKKCSCGTSFNV
ncbi:MAG: iron-sulfur-binding protein [Oligoflexia bacterium]|nr:MAG: iron-sulfur-binding protein [Oligoflexia bacterium]